MKLKPHFKFIVIILLLMVLIEVFVILWINIIFKYSYYDIANYQLILSQKYFPAIISIAAILLTLDEAIQTRKHNRLSVKPLLIIESYAIQSEPIRVKLFNNGLGTAIVKRIEYIIDDKTVIKTDGPSVKEMLIQLGLAKYSKLFVDIGLDEAISVNAPYILFELIPLDLKQTGIVIHTLQRLQIKITYESIYEEQFVYITKAFDQKGYQ